MNKKLLGTSLVLLIILGLLTAGCGGQDKNETVNKKQESTKPADLIKDLNEKAIVEKINALIESDDLKTGAAIGEEAAKRFPNSIEIPLATSSVYFYQENYKKLVEISSATLKKSPNNPLLLNQLAWGLIETGENPKEGLSLVRKSLNVLQKDGNDYSVEVLDTFGYALLKNGKYNDAVTVLEKATEKLNSSEVNKHLAMALEGAKKSARAKQVWKNVQGLAEVELKDASNPPAQIRRIEKIKKEADAKIGK